MLYKWEDIQVLMGAGKLMRSDPHDPESQARLRKVVKQGFVPILECASKRCPSCKAIDKGGLDSPKCRKCISINCATERERGKQVFRSLPGQEYDFEVIGGQNYFKLANI